MRPPAPSACAFMVILYQSYVAQDRSTEVVARGNYFKAQAALDRSLGRGRWVSRPSEALRTRTPTVPAILLVGVFASARMLSPMAAQYPFGAATVRKRVGGKPR